jgi:hypothetical protein
METVIFFPYVEIGCWSFLKLLSVLIVKEVFLYRVLINNYVLVLNIYSRRWFRLINHTLLQVKSRMMGDSAYTSTIDCFVKTLKNDVCSTLLFCS